MVPAPRPIVVIPGDDPMQIATSPRLDLLRQHAEVRLFLDRPDSDDEKLRRAAGAQVIINSRSSVKWPGEILRQLPALKMIAVCGIGTDAIDVAAARELGIVVSNIPGRTAPVVAEHALALLFGAARRLAYQTAELRAGRWTARENIFLHGKTLGVIGTGAIGKAMIRLAQGVGMKVVAWTFHPQSELAAEWGFEYVTLEALLQRSDAVSLHVKLTPESRHLLGARELGLMKPGALLVNTARAAIVDTEAMIAALNNGHLAGAALDVFDNEPLRADAPILQCEQLILTPHNADQTPEGADFLNLGAVENVIAFLQGTPQNNVCLQG